MNPEVSLIMPVYNAESYLHAAIESILRQTFSNWQLLICDDASTDKSMAILSGIRDERIKVFRNEVNQGYLRTCNFLFQNVSTKWIGFQDADDISHPSRLERQMMFLKDHPEIVLCGTSARYFFRLPERFFLEKTAELSHTSILRAMKVANQFCGASVIVRNDVMREVGYYQDYFSRIGNEDYDCFYRITQRYPVANIDEPLYFVRNQPSSVSRTIRRPGQLYSAEIVRFLARQREQFDSDSLTGLEPRLLEDMVRDFEKPFVEDPSKIWRSSADMLHYARLRGDAFKSALRAFMVRPGKFINLKYVVTLFLRMLLP